MKGDGDCSPPQRVLNQDRGFCQQDQSCRVSLSTATQVLAFLPPNGFRSRWRPTKSFSERLLPTCTRYQVAWKRLWNRKLDDRFRPLLTVGLFGYFWVLDFWPLFDCWKNRRFWAGCEQVAVTANHCASVCASTVHQLCFCSFVSTVYEVCISCASTDPDRSSGASQISVGAPKPNLNNCIANNDNPPIWLLAW